MLLNLLKSAETVKAAVDIIISDLSLRERVDLAKLLEGQSLLLKRLLSFQICCKFAEISVNKKLKRDCLTRSGQKELSDAEAAGIIIEEVYRRLRETHRIRVVDGSNPSFN